MLTRINNPIHKFQDVLEYTVVLKGILFVETKEKIFEVNAGQAIMAHKGEWVRYSTPGGAEYIAVCIPAFTPDAVNRDAK